ncbi:MAG: YceI family protein [Actinomycetales bacterium]
MTTATVAVTTPSGRTLEGLVPGVWTVDTAHSEVGFVARHLMVSKVRGRFTDYDATITVAPNVLDSHVEATVQLDSLETKDDKRDGHLKSEDFFHVEQHPTMTFRSTGIRENGSDFLLDGDLTIRGVTKPVTFDLEFNGVAATPWGGSSAGFTAETEINRKDWGLNWNVALESGGVLVSDKVKIILEIEATAPQAEAADEAEGSAQA